MYSILHASPSIHQVNLFATMQIHILFQKQVEFEYLVMHANSVKMHLTLFSQADDHGGNCEIFIAKTFLIHYTVNIYSKLKFCCVIF